MADQSDRAGKPGKTKKTADRQARLEQALRANLLKRKAKGREGKRASASPKEGGQD
jgi:hypothetical protein